MRELFCVVSYLLVILATVNSSAIYRQYRELEVPLSVAVENALPKDQIPVQVIEVDPVLFLESIDNLRNVQSVAVEEPMVMSNDVVPDIKNLPNVYEEKVVIPLTVIKNVQSNEPPMIDDVIEEKPLRSVAPEVVIPIIASPEHIAVKISEPEPTVAAVEALEKLRLVPESSVEKVLQEKIVKEDSVMPEVLVEVAKPSEVIIESAQELRNVEKINKEVDGNVLRQAANNPAPEATTARPTQNLLQQFVQNTPLGTLFNNFAGTQPAAGAQNDDTIAPTNPPQNNLFQLFQNTTSQITSGFQQQFQNLQALIPGNQPAGGSETSARPPSSNPLQFVTNFLGGGNNQQQNPPAANPGPFQGILNLFNPNANRASTTLAPLATSTAQIPVDDKVDTTRNSMEEIIDSLEESGENDSVPEDIVVDESTQE